MWEDTEIFIVTSVSYIERCQDPLKSAPGLIYSVAARSDRGGKLEREEVEVKHRYHRIDCFREDKDGRMYLQYVKSWTKPKNPDRASVGDERNSGVYLAK